MENNYLPLFITEELYLVKGDELTMKAQETPSESTPVQEPTAQTQPKDDKPAIATPKITTPKKEEPAPHELAIWCPPLTKEDRELLSKILLAIKKDFNKAFLMEGIASYQSNYQTLICFGYHQELEFKTGQTLSPYTPLELSGQRMLASASPSDLHGDPAQKKRLWEALQAMFL